MRRVVVLGILIACGALSCVVTAYQQPQAPRFEVNKLKDNLFVLRNGGGNTAVFVTTDGVTVVDTKLPGWGQPVLDKIKELSAKPVVRIINTHAHIDHVSGNVEFPTAVDIVVHENTAANMKKMPPVTGLGQPGAAPPPNIFEQNNGRGLAKRTFKDKMTIGKGADQIDVYYFGRGHTNGDAWILFPALRVVHSGDIFPGKTMPLIDAKNGGSATEYPESLSKAHALLNKMADTVITGHSRQVMTMNDLREYADLNREFLTAVRAQKKAGRSAEDVAATWTIPSKYTGYETLWPPEIVKTYVQIVFAETK